MRNPGEYHRKIELSLKPQDVDFAFEAVFRHDLKLPGFVLLDLGADVGSRGLREAMIALREGLEARLTDESLDMLWLGRFDQQATTEFHLDSAADESFLMLGYEPTKVESALFLADFAAWVEHSGQSAQALLHSENPMYVNRAAALSPFVTALEAFERRHFQILLINNSNGNLPGSTLGVMHKAVISHPDPAFPRVINSMMLCRVPTGHPRSIDSDGVLDFLQTEVVLRS